MCIPRQASSQGFAALSSGCCATFTPPWVVSRELYELNIDTTLMLALTGALTNTIRDRNAPVTPRLQPCAELQLTAAA
jgi:hypothetical protein